MVLKGPTFEALLYDASEYRFSRDLDLLVQAEVVPNVEPVLRRLGFEPFFLPEDEPTGVGTHAGAWRRERDESWVDLHHTIAGVEAPSNVLWEALREHWASQHLADANLRVLDRVACAMLVALHTAHHGPQIARHSPRGVDELRRALARFDQREWEEAAALARRLGATEAFAIGLRLVPEGVALASALGLSGTVDARRRLAWSEAPYGARALAAFADASFQQRVRLVVRLLVPNPRSMRLGTPLARRGRFGLAAAYALRPLRLVQRLPGALRAVRAARRAVERPGRS